MKNKSSLSRREFLKFMGITGAALSLNSFATSPLAMAKGGKDLPFQPISPTLKDDVVLAKGLSKEILIQWSDAINRQGEFFGFNNDFTLFLPLKGKEDEALLWVNHEYTNPLFVSGYTEGTKTRAQVEEEQLSVGGSILKIHRNQQGDWKVVFDDPLNRRITAKTPMKMISEEPFPAGETAIGTLANCAGGSTPWGTILTCEENYHSFYGDIPFENRKNRRRETIYWGVGWEKHFNYSPYHYGWVVEIDPQSGKGRKLTALGRFAHEGACVITAEDGRHVVYMGDDAKNQCVFKFISEKPGSLDRGTLYVANVKKGQWIPLVREKHPILKKYFKNQIEVLIFTRQAAKLVGGTPLDRPEDIEQNPHNGDIIVSLTNNKPKNNYYGSLMKIKEKDRDPLAMSFQSSTFLAGGPKSGFACPDNLAFDPQGNLWMTSDISGSSIGEGPYKGFGNNGLFYIPVQGPRAGEVFQIASAPVEAEFTGPSFSPQGRTLFLSVQHPGEKSTHEKLTSHWPGGKDSYPRPAVITIQGPVLDKLSAR